MFEHYIKEQIYDLFSPIELLCKKQYGLITATKALITIKALELIVEKVQIRFENKTMLYATLIDL